MNATKRSGNRFSLVFGKFSGGELGFAVWAVIALAAIVPNGNAQTVCRFEFGLRPAMAPIAPGGAFGGAGELGYQATPTVSFVSEVGGYQTVARSTKNGTPGPDPVRSFTYTIGPRIYLVRLEAFAPFLQARFGALNSWASGAGSSIYFLSTLGAGVDLKAAEHVVVRAIQLDDYMVTGPAGTLRAPHVGASVGVVIKFGRVLPSRSQRLSPSTMNTTPGEQSVSHARE